MSTPHDRERPTEGPDLTTKEARQADRHYGTFVVLAVALALLVVVGLALTGVRF